LQISEFHEKCQTNEFKCFEVEIMGITYFVENHFVKIPKNDKKYFYGNYVKNHFSKNNI
jgi:hypothetical protein